MKRGRTRWRRRSEKDGEDEDAGNLRQILLPHSQVGIVVGLLRADVGCTCDHVVERQRWPRRRHFHLQLPDFVPLHGKLVQQCPLTLVELLFET